MTQPSDVQILAMDNEALAVALQQAAVEVDLATKRMGKLEQLLTARLEDLEAKRVNCEGGHFELSYPTAQYNQDKLQALAELKVLDDLLSEGYTPGHSETVWIKPNFNMTQVNKWGRQYGAPVQDVIDGARLPDTKGPKVKYVADKPKSKK